MHYICTAECKGVSDKPGNCEAKECSKHGEPLQSCDCKDGEHNGKQEKGKKEKS